MTSGEKGAPSGHTTKPAGAEGGSQCSRCGADLVSCARCGSTSYCPACTRPRRRKRSPVLRQEPAGVTWAREKAGLTKRALARQVGISEQLMGEIESGWRSATPANLAKIAQALKCPVVILERNPRATDTHSLGPAQHGP
ncbi:helix-turn-helix domain-containing protein [Streptomyces sp. NPDC049040]|uniref:helix-turn-helix domain-containing protein n=1 Tax=Streptomyces sp. NPDC049040 TaxID=3365593 RepID=UPI0037149C47